MKKYNVWIMVWVFMVSCASLNACNETDEETNALDKTATAEFLKQATATDMYEITAGMMAQDNGVNQGVTSLGQQMVHIHSRTSQALTDMAKRKNVQLSGEMNADKKRVVKQMEDKKGTEFDENFISNQITAYQESIALYEKADRDIKDQEIQGFVDQILPVLREHLAQAQKVQTGMVSKK